MFEINLKALKIRKQDLKIFQCRIKKKKKRKERLLEELGLRNKELEGRKPLNQKFPESANWSKTKKKNERKAKAEGRKKKEKRRLIGYKIAKRQYNSVVQSSRFT